MEQNTSNEPLGAKAPQRFDSPVRLTIHSVRKRLADPDGISAKAAIDGIVNFGLLVDDSASFVEEVRFTQEKIAKGQSEETIITIETVE